MKKHLSYVTKQLEDLTGEYDVLEMAFDKVEEYCEPTTVSCLISSLFFLTQSNLTVPPMYYFGSKPHNTRYYINLIVKISWLPIIDECIFLRRVFILPTKCRIPSKTHKRPWG